MYGSSHTCNPPLKYQNNSGDSSGIWPRLKRDRRRDGCSLFGPPGQLAKREQPGTGNDEERRRALETLLEQFSPKEGVQILQYVDDLLISGETEKEVKNVSIQLLNIFGEKGLKVSQSKLQFVETEVTYLGHIIGKGSKRLSPARISGIVSISPPKTKRDVRKLLGLFGYCKHWIDKYTQGVKFLYDKLIDQEQMNWTESDEKQLQDLKEKLSSAPVLSLSDLKKEFDLFVSTEKGIAYGVLTQEWGGYQKPVAFLSKLLDPVARGWPACLQAVTAAAILIEEAQKLTLQGKIKIHTPHDLKTILSQRAQKWLTDSRILNHEIILINTDNLELTTSKSLNPAQFLSGEPTEEVEHHCLELIDMQTKVREDLEDTPLPYGRVLFTDGSSRVVEGKRTSGYSVIEGEKMEVLEKGKLPSNWSAQCCEIYALKRGLDLLKDDRGTIYTDSRYAFGIVHTFGKIWEGRGYLNSKGKDLIHTELIKSVLKSLQKPVEITVVHIKGHQKGNMPEIRGNQLADKTAREAALEPGEPVKILKLEKIPRKEKEEIEQVFSEKEQKAIKELGLHQGEHGVWLTADGRKFLNKALARKILTEIHNLTHWGTQGLCDHFLRENLCIGVHELAKAVTQGCIICQKINQKVMRKTEPGGRELALRPFQNVQIDFTEMPPVQGYKHLLVIIDHLTHWVEAFPTKRETAEVVTKIILEDILPRSKDYLEGEEVTRKYLKTIGQTLENLRKKGYLPQTSPLDANVHINPGDWVLIKTWTNTPLTAKFEGPYQVLLTTHTAVRTEEKGWTHITRVKGPVPPPGENPSSAPSPDETEWTVTPHPKDLKLTFKKK
ncbi:hypothetical protein DUI87_28867 [Hirundo rustica rustica]|uniref:ribonuclease H n=1 Tax=Hirundo rustica rustica TaxID=333673 RepID=A0A3M0J1L8_HIRRU|nr:hypothetical protein DUI87_28867 [Hirundo rustica rustica]